MLRQVRAAFVVLAVMTVITGVLYPLLITGVAQAAFPHQANGSLIVRNDKVVGSELIGQPFDDPKYFWGRISATAPVYNAQSSTGSNLGPTNPALADEVKGSIDALHKADPEAAPEVPVDLVTSSGSGLDPDISPAAGEYQVRRVAKARGLGEERVRSLVAEHTTGRQLGVLGEPRVNVLELNLALDALR
jgi:potassium-transporting ATPase KdpC subunit